MDKCLVDEVNLSYIPLKSTATATQWGSYVLTTRYGNQAISLDCLGSCVCVAGSFDGFHRGHQALVARGATLAEKFDLPLIALTFEPDPMYLFNREVISHDLLTPSDKVRHLIASGVQAVVTYDFTHAFARLSLDDFAQGVLRDTLHVDTLVVGSNFTMGYKGSATPDDLQKLDICHVDTFDLMTISDLRENEHLSRQYFSQHTQISEAYEKQTQDMIHTEVRVDVLDELPLPQDTSISSTRIRELVLQGNVEQAAALLGHYPQCSGVVVHGRGEGRVFGFPTANISIPKQQCIMQKGVFAGVASDGQKMWSTAVHMGRPVSFENHPEILDWYAEANLVDCNEDLYDKELKIFFVKKIGETVIFDSLDELKEMLFAYKKWVEDNIGVMAMEVNGDFRRGKGARETSD